MIVTQISAPGTFGILDFEWDSSVPDFRRFNLVYGWNRSGKTTLSRIFYACEDKSIAFRRCPECAGFRLKTRLGATVEPENLEDCGLSVKVFNQDFVERNVTFDSAACRPIVFISEEDIAAQEDLNRLRAKTNGLTAARESARREKIAAERAVEAFLESTALSIKNTLGDFNVQDKYRTYDKRNLRALLDGAEPPVELADDDFLAAKAATATDLPEQDEISDFALNVRIDGKEITDLGALHRFAVEILNRNVVAKTIDRLQADSELNAWVREGLALQRRRGELEACPYCEKPLDEGFIEHLADHFSDEYEKLRMDAAEAGNALDGVVPDPIDENLNVYPELNSRCVGKIRSANALQLALQTWVEECQAALRAKHDAPFKSMALAPPPSGLVESWGNLVSDLNAVLREHNDEVRNHSERAIKKKDALASHLAAAAMREQGFGDLKQELKTAQEREQEAVREADANESGIAELIQRASNIGAAIDKINGHLDGFFGENEIQLELDASEAGYLIKRCGRDAQNLSEGEKSAIAFSYFIAKIQEKGFRLDDGVVVLDDPVSSLDSNYIFHCFSLIQRHMNTAGQLFILTHNFELLNLAKAWFTRKNRKRNPGEGDCGFYTIENEVVDGERRARIVEMDRTLRDYNSEYQYLFARLVSFREQPSANFADLYTMGNIARRFLEVYASFKIPTVGDLRGKVEKLPTRTITAAQKDRVYRLVQEFSHAQDPTCAIVHKDRVEAQDAIAILLRIVEESDEPHYRLLRKSLPV